MDNHKPKIIADAFFFFQERDVLEFLFSFKNNSKRHVLNARLRDLTETDTETEIQFI